jgi:hypothetical protein
MSGRPQRNTTYTTLMFVGEISNFSNFIEQALKRENFKGTFTSHTHPNQPTAMASHEYKNNITHSFTSEGASPSLIYGTITPDIAITSAELDSYIPSNPSDLNAGVVQWIWVDTLSVFRDQLCAIVNAVSPFRWDMSSTPPMSPYLCMINSGAHPFEQGSTTI